MTDDQFAMLSTYLRDIGNRLLLADWELVLDRSAADSGAWAQIHVKHTENRALVRVCWPEFFTTRTPEEQREDIGHECLHCHVDRPHRIVDQLAEQFSDNAAMQFAKDAHNNETEICTQRFARLLAPHLPLPPTEVKG